MGPLDDLNNTLSSTPASFPAIVLTHGTLSPSQERKEKKKKSDDCFEATLKLNSLSDSCEQSSWQPGEDQERVTAWSDSENSNKVKHPKNKNEKLLKEEKRREAKALSV